VTIAFSSLLQNAPTPAAVATPGIHLGQTPAYSVPTPAANSLTPAYVWGAPTNADTPGDAMVPSYNRLKEDEDGKKPFS
jgi:hypothetical protein